MRLIIFQHLAHEDAGNIKSWAASNGHLIDIFLVPQLNSDFPSLQYDGLLILGGTMGVNDIEAFPWLGKEINYIKSFIRTGKPVVGICLGSQLLSAALGAIVIKNQHKEIGFFPVIKTELGKANLLLHDIPEHWMVLHWHGDTFEIPPGAEHLLYSKGCSNQGYNKDNCWGFQFHPEIDESLLNSMIDFEREELKEDLFIQNEQTIKAGYSNYNHPEHFHSLLNRIFK